MPANRFFSASLSSLVLGDAMLRERISGPSERRVSDADNGPGKYVSAGCRERRRVVASGYKSPGRCQCGWGRLLTDTDD